MVDFRRYLFLTKFEGKNLEARWPVNFQMWSSAEVF